MKQPRTCSECDKPFKPMTEKQWTVNRYIHRVSAASHERLRNPEYLEMAKADYNRERQAQGLAF
jgi:hypothetical protein